MPLDKEKFARINTKYCYGCLSSNDVGKPVVIVLNIVDSNNVSYPVGGIPTFHTDVPPGKYMITYMCAYYGEDKDPFIKDTTHHPTVVVDLERGQTLQYGDLINFPSIRKNLAKELVITNGACRIDFFTTPGYVHYQ
jgi:hypothetical protein